MSRIRIMEELKRAAVNDDKFYNWYMRLVVMEVSNYDLFNEIMDCFEIINFDSVREMKAFFNKCIGIYDLYTKCKMAV